MRTVSVLLLVLGLTLTLAGSAPAQGHVYAKVAPSGPQWTTTSTTWVDIQDLDLWFYQYDEGNACIGIAAESYATTGKRMFVRAVVDDDLAFPSDVVFTSENLLYGRSFLFTANVGPGIHHVALQVKVDGDGTASFGDRSAWVITSPNLVNAVAAPSGAFLTTTSAAWADISDMSLNITMPVDGQLALTFSSEVLCDNGTRTFLRVLIDDGPSAPSDIVVASDFILGVHAATFLTPQISAGSHAVKVQWLLDGTGTAYMGDRTLAVAVLDPTGAGSGGNGIHSVSPPSGPAISTVETGWEDISGLALDMEVPDNSTLIVGMNGETVLTGGRLFVRATIDGESCAPSDAVLQLDGGSPGTCSMAFVKKAVSGGSHRVAMQWGVDGGQTGYMGDRNLTVAVFKSDAPELTSDFPGVTPAIRANPIVVILWDPQRPTDPAPSVGAMSNLVHGSYPSVADYFTTLSGGKFSVTNAGILGWFNADKDPSFYWSPNDPTDADGDGFISGHVRKWWEAVTKADPVFNFAAFDTDADGVLDPEELGIVIVIPQNSAFGTNRVPASQEYPTWQPLVVDGVRIPMISEMYAGSPPNLGLFVHELCHLLLNLPDLYFGFFFPFAAGAYSIMDVTYIDSHLDPLEKMRLGWLQPMIVDHTGTYSVDPAEDGGGAYVLMDPAHGNSEYYIVENRQRSFAYDTQLSDSGLAVWHVIEDPAVYGTIPAPAGVGATDWNAIPAGDWGRRAIRMIRPVYGPPFNNGKALWDGADPTTGYDLVSDDPVSGHGQLRWADGSPSGFAIRDISAATPAMSAVFELPGSPVGVEDVSQLPTAFALNQNYPNPFNPTTVIRYQLPVVSDVRLIVYDVLGREIARLVDERQPAGTKDVVWDASGKSTGVYFCRLDVTGGNGERYAATVKLVLVR